MATDTRGIFALIEVVDVALSDEWVNLDDVWISKLNQLPNTGYFGGGYVSAAGPQEVSIMDKLTYSTDTTVYTPSANLSVARWRFSATGNSTAGYFGGGYDGSVIVSTMDKLTYSTDTTVYTPGANLSAARQYAAGTSSLANALPGTLFTPNIV